MITFVPDTTAPEIKISAYESESFLGCCTFTIDGYYMDFVTIECDDDLITEGLARAAMNCAANRSVYIARLRKDFFCPAFKRLGFEGGDVLSVEIPEALGSGCSCCHN